LLYYHPKVHTIYQKPLNIYSSSELELLLDDEDPDPRLNPFIPFFKAYAPTPAPAKGSPYFSNLLLLPFFAAFP